MDKTQVALLASLEAIGLILIVRLWLTGRMSVNKRIVWSAILLLPLFGPLIFGFLRLNPSEHDYDPPDNAEDPPESCTR